MFREMRKKDREVFGEYIEIILTNGEYGVLATVGENGYPYTVPLSYVYQDNSIYFHCAKEGHKLDNIEKNPKVSFCVVTDTEVLPGKFSTNYKSIIAFGEAKELTGALKRDILFEFIKKYSQSFIEEGKRYIEKAQDSAKIIEIKIEHITGKSRG
ncbi:MFS transporter [Clostridium sulfidigenes]|uniref:MFS transporter n=1 Tax=Clostridium sulfidigenes TaxID=318464 RepID=A0A084JDI8_9CLOT|nr:pyridoxamine 5'-phosphate oxidase family protein [Clostridium sulfidigenes]KEZ87022.1 MFS transporter [Clostridium sulfidigenes]